MQKIQLLGSIFEKVQFLELFFFLFLKKNQFFESYFPKTINLFFESYIFCKKEIFFELNSKMESFSLTHVEKKCSISMSHVFLKRVQFCESCDKKGFNSVSHVIKRVQFCESCRKEGQSFLSNSWKKGLILGFKLKKFHLSSHKKIILGVKKIFKKFNSLSIFFLKKFNSLSPFVKRVQFFGWCWEKKGVQLFESHWKKVQLFGSC